jgi:glycosyltransferase involved in cell wall biosynthesis
MTVIAFEYAPSTLLGGSERSYFDVLTGLKSRGHTIILHHTEDGNLVARYKAAGIETRKIETSYIIRPGHRLGDMRKVAVLLRRLREFRGRNAVVYLNFAEALPLAALIKLLYGVRVVCHIRLGYFGLSRQILLAGRFADRLIVINKRFRDTFARVFKRRDEVMVIYNGLTIPSDLPSPLSVREGHELRILYLGRVAPEKGVIELVRAAADAIRAGISLSVQVTGDFIMSHSGDYRAELADAVDKAGMRSHINFSGAVDEPLRFMRGFDLFVMPATWEEPFGRTVPEAILAGIPVLSRKVGMMDEIMADNPHFLFTTDKELTEKIIQFAGGNLVFDFAAARDRIVTDFNKDRMIDQVEKVLEDVCRA